MYDDRYIYPPPYGALPTTDFKRFTHCPECGERIQPADQPDQTASDVEFLRRTAGHMSGIRTDRLAAGKYPPAFGPQYDERLLEIAGRLEKGERIQPQRCSASKIAFDYHGRSSILQCEAPGAIKHHLHQSSQHPDFSLVYWE